MTEPRQAKLTVEFVDDYCQWYESLFPEVRRFEAFKYLHIGMLAPATLPQKINSCRISNCDRPSVISKVSSTIFIETGKLGMSKLRGKTIWSSLPESVF